MLKQPRSPVSRMITVLGIIRNQTENTKITALTIETLLRVAAADPKPLQLSDLRRDMSISQAAVARNVAILSETSYRRPGEPREEGLGLVEKREAEHDARIVEVSLSAAGRKLMDTITKKLEG